MQITSAAGTVKTAEICEIADILGQVNAGDVNADGTVNSADAVLLQKYLLTEETALPDRIAADIDRNGVLSASDLAMLKRILLNAK